jgi:Arc/MetJ family transcription regulator
MGITGGDRERVDLALRRLVGAFEPDSKEPRYR